MSQVAPPLQGMVPYISIQAASQKGNDADPDKEVTHFLFFSSPSEYL